MVTNLLSTTSRVEAPYIEVTIGNYTFGSYNKTQKTSLDDSGVRYTQVSTTFPNYMKSLNVIKVNGAVNTYNINMVYGIRAGDDPNLLEKVFSSVSNTRKISISYGDYCSPTFIYKTEEAIITKVTSNVDLAGSSITYMITCTSEALSLAAGTYSFPARHEKPSKVIKDILYSNTYGILEIFYGMRDRDLVLSKGLIASDDKEVTIEAKQNITIFEYLNYLVQCMSSRNDSPTSIIKSSAYAFTVIDDTSGIFGGPYFKVSKISRNLKSINSIDMYEIDVGYPTANIVTSFTIDDDETYSILYNYSQKVEQSDYIYRIDNAGNTEYIYSPMLSNSKQLLKTTEADKSWWTKMTQYPIKATLTIKGLLRPAILMNYVKVNVYFFGRKHISSGIYIITQQQDTIDQNGYRTTLSLTRVQGDEDL
jgi:hypothetical protein